MAVVTFEPIHEDTRSTKSITASNDTGQKLTISIIYWNRTSDLKTQEQL